ncbi:hypothetical protein FGO68_gene11231 [Halteria grandinella]|uniref:Uncharacterized protein n=1 Tax=Halteria grandinella TaxID=5974 RepID=A0A8J8NF11_HALGN|nr:hypothetical protein FGO68_gene11231 [Halteria grandinella]
MKGKGLNEFLTYFPNPSKKLYFNDLEYYELYEGFFKGQAIALRDSPLEHVDYTTKRLKLKFCQSLEPLMIHAVNYLMAKSKNLEDLTISFAHTIFDEDALDRVCKDKIPPLDLEGECFNYNLSRLKKLKLKILGPVNHYGYYYNQANYILEQSQIHQAIEYLCKTSKATLTTLKIPARKRESRLPQQILQAFLTSCLTNLNQEPNLMLKKLQVSMQIASFYNVRLLKDHFNALQDLTIEDGNNTLQVIQINSFKDIIAIQSLKRLTLRFQCSLRNLTYNLELWDVFAEASDNLKYIEMDMPLFEPGIEKMAKNKKAGFTFVNKHIKGPSLTGIVKPICNEEIIAKYPHIRFDFGPKPSEPRHF